MGPSIRILLPSEDPMSHAPSRGHLIGRALNALNPDPSRVEGARRALVSIASMSDAADLLALVEGIERAAGDLSRQLLVERYGSRSSLA